MQFDAWLALAVTRLQPQKRLGFALLALDERLAILFNDITWCFLVEPLRRVVTVVHTVQHMLVQLLEHLDTLLVRERHIDPCTVLGIVDGFVRRGVNLDDKRVAVGICDGRTRHTVGGVDDGIRHGKVFNRCGKFEFHWYRCINSIKKEPQLVWDGDNYVCRLDAIFKIQQKMEEYTENLRQLEALKEEVENEVTQIMAKREDVDQRYNDAMDKITQMQMECAFEGVEEDEDGIELDEEAVGAVDGVDGVDATDAKDSEPTDAPTEASKEEGGDASANETAVVVQASA